jgi:peroxiredoxin
LEPLSSKLDEIKVQLVYVAAEKRNGMFKPEEFLQKNPTSFPFLLDEDRSVTKSYGVYNRLSFEAINIARPATFVVAHEGVIRFIHVGSIQTDMADVQQVVTILDQLIVQ